MAKPLKQRIMKSITFVLLLTVCSFFTAQAQAGFKAGDVEIAAGMGVFSTYFKDGAQTVVPPLSARLQVRLVPNFSLGAFAAYSSSEVKQRPLPDGTFQDISNETLLVGLRAAAHSHRLGNWDVYGGLTLGYAMPDIQESINGLPKSVEPEGPSFRRSSKNTVLYSAFVGATYYPLERIGVFGEVGYGISILSFGLSARL